jgi:hypothetical protein
LGFSVLLLHAQLLAQVNITHPADRSVFQRDITGRTTLSVAGSYTQPVDRVEVRAVAVIPGQGINTDWQLLQENPRGGLFQGTIRLQGGWYTLEVRGFLRNELVGRNVVPRVGVGEVFLIAGQSNAQGLREFPGPGAKDDRVNYIVYDNTVNSLFDPPRPTFAQLADGANIGPRGQTPWCWGILGDQLAQKLNVPILFINTAWEGTSVRNWAESAAGRPTFNVYGGFRYDSQMPYANLLIAARYYVHQLGVRAILWMQGETDTWPLRMSRTEYQENLQFLLNKLGGDTDKRINWVITRTSRSQDEGTKTSITSSEIIIGQNAVINTPFNATYPGPETDNAFVPRPDGVHFKGGNGYAVLAGLWNTTMNASFFSTVTPLVPTLTPTAQVECGPDNASLIATLPEGFSSYEWNTGQRGRVLTITSVGTYQATLRDANGNSVLGPSIVVTSVRPQRPTVIPNNPQQACADSGFVFLASGGTDSFLWSNGAVGQSARISQSGSYTVKAVNMFGCESELSEPVSLTVRPALTKPVIEQSGPYSITATVPSDGSVSKNRVFDWRAGTMFLNPTAATIKVVNTGEYRVREREVFTLGSSQLTCFSPFSDPFAYTSVEEDAIVIFPNPTSGGIVAIETRDDLTNAEVAIYNSKGSIIRTQRFPILRQRQIINASTLPSGSYLVRVRAPGVDVTKRLVID